MTRPGYTCRSRTGNIAPKLSPKDRKSRTEELVCHLLSFTHALSYETARYLDILSFSGQAAADEVAAERGWKIDPAIVAEYRAGVAEIVARYCEVEQSGQAQMSSAEPRHQIQMIAPHCWSELRGKLTATADSYRTVTVKAPRCDLEIMFSPDEPKITYEIKNTSPSITPCYGTFSFLLQDDVVCLRLEAGPGNRPFDRTGVPLTVDEVAAFLLGKLV